MHFDPTTVCVRTFAGEAEAQRPAHGLSIAQRRVLVLLDRPRGLAHFAALHHLPPARLERDLTQLAALGLVALLSADEAQALAAEPPAAAAD
ncbi:MAG TPA: hypothetical protein VFX05_03280 [Casimicrobiaceae bacterium]|nr:hypothetical protein [Casimicrobiaceae bacterium]